MSVDWGVDGINVVLVTGCDVCWFGCGRYQCSVGDGMWCLLIGVWTVSWLCRWWWDVTFVYWCVDGIMVVLVTVGCDVCWFGCGRYCGSVSDGGMWCLLIGVWTVSWFCWWWWDVMFVDWGVDGIVVDFVMVGCDVCWLGCGRYHGSVGDGWMWCLLIGVLMVSS